MFAAEGDGKEGVPTLKPQLPTPEEILKSRDANDDGKLSKEEFLAPFRKPEKKVEFAEKFKKFDVNEDGFLTLDELKAGMKPGKKGPKKTEETK
jgi:hypothetical protein